MLNVMAHCQSSVIIDNEVFFATLCDGNSWHAHHKHVQCRRRADESVRQLTFHFNEVDEKENQK